MEQDAEKMQRELAVTQGKIKDITAKQQQCQRNLTAAETRAQSLRRLQDNYEGFSNGI